MQQDMQVMIVDDDNHWLYLVTERLADLRGVHCNVRATTRGEAAIDLAAEEKFDLCFVDIRLGSMDGFEVVKKIHEIMPTSSLVLMTGLAESEQLERKATSSGANDLVYKDHFDDRSLMRVVNSALHRKNAANTGPAA